MLTMFRWIALIAAIVLIVAVVGTIVSSEQPLESAKQQTTEKNQAEHAEQKGHKTLWDTWFPDSISLYTLFLVVFTAVLALGGVYQLRLLTRAEYIAANSAQSAKQSAEVAERALIAGRRAFVSVTFKHTANQELKTGHIVSWGFTPVWINTGDTPTRLFENHISISIREMNCPATGIFPIYGMPAYLPNPADESISECPPKGSNDGQTLYVDVDALDEIIAGRKFLYFWGWGAYNDVFPSTQRHVTLFAVSNHRRWQSPRQRPHIFQLQHFGSVQLLR
jgi:hypothetical protein